MKHLFLLLATLLSALLSGCDQLEYKGEPQYTLYIQDAPADYKSLTMSISAVELYNGSQWVPVATSATRFNLLSLTGGAMLKIASSVMPEGRYSALKITFNPDNIQLYQNKTNHTVTILPENKTLTINTEIELKKDFQFTSILDIDAAASIIENPDATYEFIPRAKLFDINQMGVLNFMVTNAKNQPIAETILIKACITGRTDTTYTYINPSTAHGLLRLTAGAYDLFIVPDQAINLYPDTLRNIQITAGEPTNLPAIQLISTIPQ